MFGIADYGAFCAAILLFLALPGPGTFALLTSTGKGGFRAARVESGGDHRIAMSAAILALLGDGPSRIVDVDCISTSFPRFVATLRALGATIDVER